MATKNNRTLDILKKAEEGGCECMLLLFAAQADCRWNLVFELVRPGRCRLLPQQVTRLLMPSYDAASAYGLVRAAERARSPAILQLFPITLAYGKGPFLQLCLDL